ncbi:MAG: hypothetical protein Q4A96_00615 [Candidatus Saccharibacteria bacterium]|nr:hypothetical protein [Candidatus Saccharibacteria bacterium]
MKENIVISKAADTLLQVSFDTQKIHLNAEKAQKILRDMTITGEIAGFNMDYAHNGVIMIVTNPLSWTTPELGLEKLKKAFG